MMEFSLNADIDVEELVTQYPEAVGFLADQGVVCIRCGEPYWGTLRELMTTKGMEDQVEQIVAELQTHIHEQRSDTP